MKDKYSDTNKSTSSEALKGTSAVQYAAAEAALVRKTEDTARAGAVAFADFSSTNVSSIFWGIHTLRARGTNAWNFGFPDPVQVFGNSQVSVTITEIDGNGNPFLGAATMQIYNVVPLDDGTITVKFDVNWGELLRVQFNFIIVN
jgi:hypothetical protein